MELSCTLTDKLFSDNSSDRQCSGEGACSWLTSTAKFLKIWMSNKDRLQCRSLTLRECHTYLIDLAGPSLEVLDYEPQCDSIPQFDVLDMARVAALGALTSLKLTHYELAHNLDLLQVSGLVELVLIHCRRSEQDLFAPGALTRLRRLHIEEDCSILAEREAGLEACDPDCLWMAQRLRSIGKIVLGLSNLSCVSGGGELIKIGMKEGLQAWRHSLRDEKAVWLGTDCPHHQHIWTKIS